VLECADARPEDVVDYSMIREQVSAALVDHLTPRTAEIVAAKFGLNGAPPVGTKAIAEVYGISAPRVHQVINDGLRRMRRLAPGLAGLLNFMS
jgi:DNA-directed RNA polymerase sigma subunit (sigma70/sigma32)